MTSQGAGPAPRPTELSLEEPMGIPTASSPLQGRAPRAGRAPPPERGQRPKARHVPFPLQRGGVHSGSPPLVGEGGAKRLTAPLLVWAQRAGTGDPAGAAGGGGGPRGGEAGEDGAELVGSGGAGG